MNCPNCGQEMRNVLDIYLCPTCGEVGLFVGGKLRFSSGICQEIDRNERKLWQEKIKKSLDNLQCV